MENVYPAAPMAYIPAAAGMPLHMGDALPNFTTTCQMDLTNFGPSEMAPAEVVGDAGFAQVSEYPVWQPDTWFP
jgi:hypothetical protein